MTAPVTSPIDGRVDQHVFLVFFGLLVLLPDGTPPGVLRSMVRAAAWAIDGIALVVPIALWSAWFTPGHRRVGAWAAGTFVIRHPRSPVPGSVTTRSG